jgi:hypothetical protein
MPADPPPARRALEPRESLDPYEWEGTEPRAPGDRRRSASGAMIVAFLLLVGIALLVVLI